MNKLNDKTKTFPNDATGSIYVSDWRTRKHIRTKSKFFNEPIVVKITEEKITFSKPSMDFRGKTISPNCDGSGWFYFRINCYYLEEKKYDFDIDESNEDCIVVYYK